MKVTLAAMRKNSKLTQKEVAEKVGVTSTTVGKWENNETTPKASQLIFLCRIYNCSINDISLPDKLAKSE